MGLFRLLRLLFSGGRVSRRPRRNHDSRGLKQNEQTLVFGDAPPGRRVRNYTRAPTDRSTPVVIVTPPARQPIEEVLRGRCWVVDGDTIVIGQVHIRLAGIDAPELDHPWGQQSKWAMIQLCKGQIVTARIRPELSYNRVVAECYLPDGRDLAAELVASGLALDWPKFSGGKYTHLEVPDARRRLWRADARQRGKLRLQDDP